MKKHSCQTLRPAAHNLHVDATRSFRALDGVQATIERIKKRYQPSKALQGEMPYNQPRPRPLLIQWDYYGASDVRETKQKKNYSSAYY
jgi:hypothetical protein